jgi:hypothetical protein
LQQLDDEDCGVDENEDQHADDDAGALRHVTELVTCSARER